MKKRHKNVPLYDKELQTSEKHKFKRQKVRN